MRWLNANENATWRNVRESEKLGRADHSYDLYTMVCMKALDDENVFENFKRIPDYTYELEHVSPAIGLLYVTYLTSDIRYGSDLRYFPWDAIKKNDSIGNTQTTSFKLQLQNIVALEDYNFSPTTMRYLYHAMHMIHHLMKKSDTDKINIVEIGGGYGGQCYIFCVMAQHYGLTINSYSIVDIQYPSLLQKKYLDRIGITESFNIHCIKCGDFLNWVEGLVQIDLAISNYCLSEIGKEWAKIYMEHVFEKAKSGHILWNNAGEETHLSIDEFDSPKFPNVRIIIDPSSIIHPDHMKKCRLIIY